MYLRFGRSTELTEELCRVRKKSLCIYKDADADDDGNNDGNDDNNDDGGGNINDSSDIIEGSNLDSNYVDIEVGLYRGLNVSNTTSNRTNNINTSNRNNNCNNTTTTSNNNNNNNHTTTTTNNNSNSNTTNNSGLNICQPTNTTTSNTTTNTNNNNTNTTTNNNNTNNNTNTTNINSTNPYITPSMYRYVSTDRMHSFRSIKPPSIDTSRYLSIFLYLSIYLTI
jgi:hypothetical protein